MTTAANAGPSSRPLYAIIGLLVALLLLGTGGYLFMTGQQPGALAVGGPFALVDGDGRAVTEKSWPGKYLLVFFGYTFCPDVCPTTMNTVSAALDQLGGRADRVQPLFITVDPKRDSPSVVKQYAAAFGPRVTGLTGSPDQIAAVAKAFRVYYAEHRTGKASDEYTMDHSSVLYLMDPGGRFLAPVRSEQTPEAMAAALTKLMQ